MLGLLTYIKENNKTLNKHHSHSNIYEFFSLPYYFNR